MLSSVGAIIWLICIATLINAYSDDAPELCVVSSPLVTPYFTPLLDTPRKARGCSATAVDPNAPFFERLDPANRSLHAERESEVELRDVHVIALHTVGKTAGGSPRPQPIRLNVVVAPRRPNDTGADVLDRLVVVLQSDRPVMWVLRVDWDEADLYTTAQPDILLSEGSIVEGNVNMTVTHQKWANKKALHRYIKKAFKGIASYSEVKGANHLELRVGGASSQGFLQCDMTAQEDSSVVTASLMVQLKTEGCFNENYIGDNPMDVYVVELEGGGKGRSRRVGPNTLVPVMVQLLGEGTRPVPRNVTVVLKSHQPIRWQFGARRIHGNIVVVSDREDQVENSSADGLETLEVRSQALPDDMVALLLSVATEYGPPILYAKTRHASTLRLVVGSKNKNGMRSGPEQTMAHVVSEVSRAGTDSRSSSKEEMQQQPNFPGAVFVSHFPLQEHRLDPVARLKAAMTVNCGKTVINVSFPRSLVRTLGSPHLSLRDETCVAAHNSTHATLTSHISSCGSTSNSDGRFTLFSNNVNVRFSPSPDSDDEDDDVEGGSGAGGLAPGAGPAATPQDGKIPVVCRYRPHFPGDKFTVPDDGNPVETGESSHSSLYHMEVYRDKQHKARIDFKTREAAEVELDEVLYVRAFLDGVVPMQVVTEECWISNSSDHRVGAHATLIRNTCPADLSTKIPPDAAGSLPHGVFNFQVNRQYQSLTLIYLHCRLGLCTRERERTRGNLKMCVDPGQYCSGDSLRLYLDRTVSTAQQFAHRGPLRPVVKRRPPPHAAAAPNGKQHVPAEVVSVTAANSVGESSGGGERIVYMGVSMEVAVCIAIASFVIGVGLTGALWCIHIRTDPFRQRNKQGGGGQLGQAAGGNGLTTSGVTAAAANLSPHSGCSSTNSQAAIAT